MANEIESWLIANKSIITHFRPRKWCKSELLFAYNRREKIPYIDGQPIIYDTPENAAIIRAIFGGQIFEEPF